MCPFYECTLRRRLSADVERWQIQPRADFKLYIEITAWADFVRRSLNDRCAILMIAGIYDS